MHLCWDIKLRIQDRQPPLLFWADANFKELLHKHIIYIFETIKWFRDGSDEVIKPPSPKEASKKWFSTRNPSLWRIVSDLCGQNWWYYLKEGYYKNISLAISWEDITLGRRIIDNGPILISFLFLSIWIGKGWKKALKKVVKDKRGMDNVEIDSKIFFGSEDTQKHFRRLKHFVWYFWILESHIW